MNADGKWTIVVDSPMGAQKIALDISTNGDTFTGTQTVPQGTSPIENGKISGNKFTWSSNVTLSSPMKLDFTGTVEGDKLSGRVKAGSFGSFSFAGSRAV